MLLKLALWDRCFRERWAFPQNTEEGKAFCYVLCLPNRIGFFMPAERSAMIARDKRELSANFLNPGNKINDVFAQPDGKTVAGQVDWCA